MNISLLQIIVWVISIIVSGGVAGGVGYGIGSAKVVCPSSDNDESPGEIRYAPHRNSAPKGY